MSTHSNTIEIHQELRTDARRPFLSANLKVVFVAMLIGIAGSVAGRAQDLPFSSGSTGADGMLNINPTMYISDLEFDCVRSNWVAIVGEQTWLADPAMRTWTNTAVPWPAFNSAASNLGWDGSNVFCVYGNWNFAKWTGTNWSTTSTSNWPSSYWPARVGYDSSKKQIIALGKYSTSYEYTCSLNAGSNKWVTTYTSSSSTPSSQLTYDTNQKQMTAYNAPGALLRWTGGAWVEIATAVRPVVSPSNNEGFAFDPLRNEAILFSTSGRTWAWNGTNWSQKLTSHAPPANSIYQLVANPIDQKLYGVSSNSVWTWDGTDWLAINGPTVHFDMRGRTNGIWNFTTVNVPAATSLEFIRNAANTPAIWLASGDVNIEGSLRLSGQAAGTNNSPEYVAEGGPGGFDGGAGGLPYAIAGSPGQGPGGGSSGLTASSNGALGTNTATAYLQPLLGGSGGGGGAGSASYYGGNGGAGGGAILIASSRDIYLNGSILADGSAGWNGSAGDGGAGAGGSIRLVADRIVGSGILSAKDGAGNCTGSGAGRIRLEAFQRSASLALTPWPTASSPTKNLFDNMDFTSEPRLLITSVAGTPVRQPPTGDLTNPDVMFSSAGNVTVTVTSQGVPNSTPVKLRIACEGQVIVAPTNGQPAVVLSGGTAAFTVAVPKGLGTVQATAEFVK